MQDEVEAFFGSTNITGAEAETLTAGVASDASTLHGHSSLLQDWESKSTGTDYLAEADGFVVVNLDATSNQGASMSLYTDSASTPTTLRCSLYSDNTVSKQTACMPVKKGHYYKVTLSGSADVSTMYWIPFTN
jgi:hypothetical protein